MHWFKCLAAMWESQTAWCCHQVCRVVFVWRVVCDNTVNHFARAVTAWLHKLMMITSSQSKSMQGGQVLLTPQHRQAGCI